MKATKIPSCAFLWVLALALCACGTRKAAQQALTAPSAAELVNSLTQIQLPPEEKQIPSGEREKPAVQNVQPQQPLAVGWEAGLRAALDSLCNNDSLANTSQIGICIHDLTQNTLLYARNAHHRMRPASCQKVVTAVAALHYLGAGHRMRTTLHMTGQISGTTLKGNLYVVGGMDPTVTAAEVDALVRAVAMAGIRRIQGKVCKDVTLTDGEPYGWGWCWDDDYGPLSPLLVEGKDRFSTVWMRSMAKHGITAGGPDTLVAAVCPPEAKQLAVIEHGLEPLLQTMMKESDNIYAECLFYRLAAHSGKPKAGRKQAALLINELMEQAGIRTDASCVADGSGLSLYNYTTPYILAGMLQMAYSRPELYQALLPSLPIAGVDGTLEKRMQKGPAYRRVWAKTGSVSGISSLSGYAQAANGHLLAFSIINQGVVRTAHGRTFQDKVCEILCGTGQ